MADKKPLNKPEPSRSKPNPKRHKPSSDHEQAPQNPAPELEPTELTANRSFRQGQILDIQRSLGNKNARKIIANRQSQDSPNVMGLWPFESRTYSVEGILRDESPDDISELTNEQIRAASLQQKMALVHLINWGNMWVGPNDERQVERIWRIVHWNRDEFSRALQNYPRYFEESVNFGAEIENLEPIPTLKRQFKTDVKGLANGYLNSNEELILTELERVGLPNPNEARAPTMNRNPSRGAEAAGPQEMNEPITARVQEIQAIAAQVRRAQLAQNELKRVPVGRGFTADPRYRMGAINMSFQEWAQRHHQTHPEHFNYAVFNPAVRPELGAFGDEQPPLQDYDEVKTHYDSLTAQIAEFASNYPTIHAMIGEDRLEEFALGSPQEARQMMGQVLGSVLTNINRTRPMLSSDDLDYRDLTPIHHQLRQGQVNAPSGNNYQQGINRWVLDSVLEDHQSTEFWIAMGLGSLAAVAFLVAEFATLGSATFFIASGVGLGAGAAQAGRSWENYEDLATAADATVSDEMQLVSQSQADSAQLSAVLDTVFLFLDMAGPAIRAVREARTAAREMAVIAEATQAGERAAGLEALSTLGSEVSQANRDLVTRAVTNLGVERTMEQTGKSLDELLQIVGEESDAGRRLLAFRQMGAGTLHSTQQLAELLPNLASDVASGAVRDGQRMTVQIADEIVQQAVERLGPQRTLALAGGWKKLSSLLGNNAGVADNLVAWRDGIMQDLTEYVNRELRSELDEGAELVQRTGSQDFTSDLDISLLGQNASANRQRALSFLAGRLGVQPESLSRLLYTDLFTDPRRMHLYDLIPDAAVREQIAATAAGFEREIIWNRRLYDALQAEDAALAQSIRSQMGDLGVREVRYQPLGPEDIRRLSTEIDSLHQELQAAQRAGNSARQGELATQIARKQAMINATEHGGYFSGGGVRRSVSEAEEFPGFTPAEIATEARQMLPAQQFTHVLDQLPKLDSAIRKLEQAARGSPIPLDNLANALKEVGKYGSRLTEVVGESLSGSLPAREIMDAFGNQFDQLITAARRTEGETLAVQIASDSDSLIQRTQAALRNYEQASSGILRVMQNRAAITTPGLAGANLRNMQFLVRAHPHFVRLMDHIAFNLQHAGRMIRAGSLHPAARESGAQSED